MGVWSLFVVMRNNRDGPCAVLPANAFYDIRIKRIKPFSVLSDDLLRFLPEGDHARVGNVVFLRQLPVSRKSAFSALEHALPISVKVFQIFKSRNMRQPGIVNENVLAHAGFVNVFGYVFVLPPVVLKLVVILSRFESR